MLQIIVVFYTHRFTIPSMAALLRSPCTGWHFARALLAALCNAGSCYAHFYIRSMQCEDLVCAEQFVETFCSSYEELYGMSVQ